MSFLQRASSTQTTIAFLIAGVLLLYAPALTFSPPYLHEAEVLFALQAHAIATSAHDLYGRSLIRPRPFDSASYSTALASRAS